MTASRRLFAVAIGISCSGALGLLACDDDNPSTPSNVDGGGDASNIVEEDTGTGTENKLDASGNVDSGDAGKSNTDAGDAGADAAVVVEEHTRSTAKITIQRDFALAEFFVDDQDVTWSNLPECVAVVRSPAKDSTSSAGVITIAGDIVGKDGGPAAKIDLVAAEGYAFADPDILPLSNDFTVDVSGTSAASFSAFGLQTLPVSLNLPIAVTAPTGLQLPTSPPDPPAVAVEIPSTKPFDITWTAPTGPGDLTNQRVIIDVSFSPSATQDIGRSVNLYCAFPLTKGKASIPANVLTDIKARAGGGDIGGSITITAGGQKAIVVKDSLYIIEVARADSTDSPQGGVIALK